MRTRLSVIISTLLFALLMLPVFVSTTARAQDRQTRKYTDEELLELVGMTVEAASKRPESIMEAPGVVSVLTANEIRELGVQNLSEVVQFMTGMISFINHAGDFNFLAIRGHVHAVNKKILLLVNGHPVYSALNGMFNLNTIPIEAVERIELIRGPVSVMYGTNALTGVINIVTKREPTFLNGEVRYQYGSFGTHEVRSSIGRSFDEGRFFMTGTLRGQSGYDYVVKPGQDIMGVGFSHKRYTDIKAFFSNFEYKNLEVDFAYGKDTSSATLGFMPSSLTQPVVWGTNSLYSDIRYIRDLSDRATLHFKLRLNSSYYSVETPGVGADIQRGTALKYGVESYGDFKLSEKASLLAGVLHDRYHSDTFEPVYYLKTPGTKYSFLIPEADSNDSAAYANLNYIAASDLTLVGGFRYTENSITGGHIDYRLGSLFNLRKDLVLKALYGTSYRSPNHQELFVHAFPVSIGNPNLDVEVLQGFDLSLNYNYENQLVASLCYFWNHTDNYIALQKVGSISRHENIKGHEIQGLEFEAKYRPSREFSFFFNASHILSGKNLELETDLVIVKNMFNFGFAFRPFETLSVSSSNIYRGNWGAAESFFLSNLAVYYTLTSFYPQFDFVLSVNNLFDSEYDIAEAVAFRIPTIPGGPPRSITAGIIVSF
jgi:outer membrane receptor protein involved in Fe transport